MLLAPLPYKDPERLVRIWETNSAKGMSRSRVSRGNYADWRRTAASFEAIEAFYPASEQIVSIDGEAEAVRLAMVTRGFAGMLGVEPIVRHDSPHGYFLSYSYWQRRFGGDPGVVNRSMQQDTFAVPVLGVMPRGYDFPTGADAWGVMSFGHERGARNLNVVARVRDGVSIEQARAELQAIEANLARSYPTENTGWTVDVEPLRDTLMETARPTLWLLYAGVSLLAALALFNAAVLYAVRGAARVRNVAIRVALGASRARILAQVAADSLLVCIAAGAVAIGVAWVAIHALVAQAPMSIPRIVEIGMAPSAIGSAVVLTAAAMAVMFLAGAANTRLAVNRLRLRANVTSGRIRTAFTVGEIAACVCLLTVSSHVIREFIALRQAPIGFDSSHVITARIELPLMKAGEHVRHYPTRRFGKTALDLVAAARELPGVADAAVMMRTPLGRPSGVTTYRVLPGARTGPIGNSLPVTGPDTKTALLRVVDTGYFKVLRVPLLEGRAFTAADRLDDLQIDDFDADRGAGAAIVSETFARREWPGETTLGRYLEVNDASYRSVEIVGVAADIPDGPGADAAPVVYLPFAQDPLIGFTLLARTSLDPAALSSPLRERLRVFGTDVTAFDVRPLDEVVDAALMSPRFTSRLMGAFGMAAIGFTAVALYAVVALIVTLRERDLAIRLAIGAEPSMLLRAILGQGLRLAFIGIAIGLVAALALGRVLQSTVAAVGTDPISMTISVPALMLLTTLAATYLPARRAAAIDPLLLLRSE
jgi:putative ABC transport system permease protein